MQSKLSLKIAGSLGVAAVTVAAPMAWAHHAFSAEYDLNKPQQLKGVLTKIQWVNPHSWVYIDVKNPDGTVTNWAIEFGAVAALRRRGLQRSDLPIGLELTVKGYQAKSGKHVVNAASVKLPDGRDLYAGDPNGPDAPPQ